MKKRAILKAVILAFILSLIAIEADALDYPHNSINNIGCDSCHYIYGTEPTLMLPWLVYGVEGIDDTQYNSLCWSCHNNIIAPDMETHSSLQIDNDYGNWTVECRVCHNPHYQKQFNTYGSESYLYSGISTDIQVDQPAAGKSELTMTGAGWTVNGYQGLVVIPNISQGSYGYRIESNTESVLTIKGQVDLTKVTPGVDTFAIIYGKLIYDTVVLDNIIDPLTPKTGDKTVKFLRSTGTNSFADGDTTYDGICEVCHTETTHFRNDGTGTDQLHSNMGYPAGTNCTRCHQHNNGFRGMGGGAHTTHVVNNNGPQLDCANCHDTSDIPSFKSGTDINGDGKYDLSETDVCNNCHSADGVASAKNYWTLDPGSWAAAEGEEGFCGSCHDLTPGNSKQDGTGDAAPNISGDKTTYGFFVTGHGKASGNYARLSWQDTSAAGNPAANRSCGSCHDLTTQHFNNSAKRLKPGYENDAGNSNCKQCHNPGTVAVNSPDWYTTYTDYENSAHGAATGNLKCSDCHDVHGVSGANPAMTRANQESLCYQCHKDPASGGIRNDAISNNRPGGYVSADDIEEAFSKTEKHNLGTAFTIGSGDYSLECVSCHNVHIVTGKYWDAEQGLSPVTRFTNNLTVWGDESGEKMDDFAANASGSGGWYYSVARGGIISFDQPAAYQPPKQGNGFSYEFDGDVVPDYATFCLDCHTNRVSDANPPVNWGQGVACTGNSVNPPDQRIACNAPHGLGSANRPYNWGDVALYGSSGNPDPIFSESGVTRGRGGGHFMRWPYDSAFRNAGVNFVMSCTDCHEAHGSDRSSMIRERFNVTADGDCGTGGDASPNGENCTDGGNWNSFCNACHYYYGGQHTDNSCGNASCHETNSIHRIIKNGESSGATNLWTEPSRPNYTPEIASVEGVAGYSDLTVTFSEGVYTNMDQTGALEPGDFVLVDVNGDNPRTITGVTHTPGDSTATITMSAPLNPSDIGSDTIAANGISVWGTNISCKNPPSEVTPNIPCPAGPWTVAIAAMETRPSISLFHGDDAFNRVVVRFSELVYTNPDGTGALQPSDFVYIDSDGKTITGVEHTAGDFSATIILSGDVVAATDINIDTLAPALDAIYDITGNPAHITPVILSQGLVSSISSVEGVVNDNKLKVTFETQVYSAINETGSLVDTDFVLSAGGKSITSVQHVAGSSVAFITMSGNLTSGESGTSILSAADKAIYGPSPGNFPLGTGAVLITEQTTLPSITTVEGTAGYNKMLVSFSEGVYTGPDQTGALTASDFTDSDPAWDISSVEHVAGQANAILTLTGNLAAGDIGIDTIAAVTNQVFNNIDNPAGTGAVTISGYDCPSWGSTFDFNETQYSATAADDTGLLIGTVGNPGFSFPDNPNNWYIGDETEAQATYIDFNTAGYDNCLLSTRAFTIEYRFYAGDVDLDYVDVNPANGFDDDYDVYNTPNDQDGDGRSGTYSRIAEKRGAYLLTLMRAGYSNDYQSSRAGKARFQIKYRRDNASAHSCPHPQWPDDDTVATSSAVMHQINTEIEQWPIIDNHWYKVRAVFNSDKVNVPGSNGTPVDIFIDDQGESGLDDVTEQWTGFVNASVSINGSASCKWGALPGDYLRPVVAGKYFYIGDNSNHTDIPGDRGNYMLKGKIDWLSWKPVADYTGVDDPPY